MTDVFDIAKRSEVMSRIRGKGNKTTELALVAAFHQAGIKGWRRHVPCRVKGKSTRFSTLAGKPPPVLVIKPDFVFRTQRIAVFVDGCFWHQCPLHSKVPASNRAFWERKLRRNVQRDREANKALKADEWTVIRIWEHDVLDPQCLSHAIARVRRRLLAAAKPAD